MKIGILTFHRSQNYGALLQALGLQQFVENLGHDVSFVDYWPEYHNEMYKHFSWKAFNHRSLKGKAKYLATTIGTFARLSFRHKNTRRFISENLHISKAPYYDLVIYGSDQIWRKQRRPGFDWYNPVYFGEGEVNTSHKIAYAASMGIIDVKGEKDRDFLSRSFKNFDAISVREADLQEFISKDIGLDFKQVLDPVFLLTKEQWQQKTNAKYLPNGKYILYYRLQDITITDDIVSRVVEQTGLPVIELRGYIPLMHYGKRYRFTADAQEMISLINGAEYVVTSAFHGVAMSVSLEKNFFYASEKSQSNRVQSLLQQIGLTDRIIKDGELNKVDVQRTIDYSKVNQTLHEMEQDSRGWLMKQIELCK